MRPEQVWLFHVLPDPMVGSVLYPLNELRERDPDTFRRARAKYEGREQVLELRVPLLDCLWNDVLHLSPVHPAEMIHALESAGFTPDRRRFLRVDGTELEPAQTVLFLNSTDREHRFDAGQWEWFDATSASRHTRLPQATRDYYAACAGDGTRPFLFAHSPHVLFRGSLDVSRLDVVEV
jgi:hypothetical protein